MCQFWERRIEGASSGPAGGEGVHFESSANTIGVLKAVPRAARRSISNPYPLAVNLTEIHIAQYKKDRHVSIVFQVACVFQSRLLF